MEEKFIKVVGAKEHNLKNISIDIPKNKLVVITGISGSGKSSLAFDTIYAEGQRRYVESLSAYARQFLDMQSKPDVESISGLSPAIAIDQKTTSRNPRSTVGTITEIYDHLRLLYARIGVPYSPETGLPIKSQSPSVMVDKILQLPPKTKFYILAPIVRGAKGEYRKEILNIKKQGFARMRIDGKVYTMETLPKLDKNRKHNIEVVVDRVVLNDDLGNRLADSIETALRLSDGLLMALIYKLPEDYQGDFKNDEVLTFSEKFSCPVSGFMIEEIEPRLFSFNSPYGACRSCDGLGSELFFDPNLIIANSKLSIKDGAITLWQGSQAKYFQQFVMALSKHYDFDIATPFSQLSEDIKQIIFYGTGGKEIEIEYEDGYRSFKVKKPFEGIINSLNKRFAATDSDKIREEMAKYQNVTFCSKCQGHRLNNQALSVKINNLNIGQVCQMPVEEALIWFKNLPEKLNKTEKQIANRVVKEIRRRLSFLQNVGLNYLSLNRQSSTLSGGESQRIRLASQIGSGLSGVMYVLDEPSIGLHQSDNDKLISTLKNLRDLGNSVIVVEHDQETMMQSDYLIDIGPGAGIHGGKIIAQGLPDEVIKNEKSITGQYLSGKKTIQAPRARRQIDKSRVITIKNARANNLKNVDVTIPVGIFCGICGISGGGKSSLIIHTLYKALNKLLNKAKDNPGPYDAIEGMLNIDKVIEINQSPIGRTPRSNPCTYIGAFTPIREFFTSLPESRMRGYKLGRFSFNVKGGRCEACQGDGLIKIEMHFLPDIYVKCDVCCGKRYNRETLEIRYKGKSISDILEMNADAAMVFFTSFPHIYDKFKALCDVGLGYIKIGQSATTLSGGEAQRIKLAKELSRKATGNSLYILDEPTTGLHFDDISKLLKVLHRLVDNGNSIIVIEHNLDVLKTADWIIDIGPSGGQKGGQIVACGTPEEVAANKKSVTGPYLKRVL